MFLNKLGSVLKSGGGVLNWKYISNSLIIRKVKDHYYVKREIYFQFGNFRDCHHFTSEVGHKKTPR